MPVRKSLSKKSKKVIEKHLEEFRQSHSLVELTKIGSRMMHEAAIEGELTAFLGRQRRLPHTS
jgi:hypothetical protein